MVVRTRPASEEPDSGKELETPLDSAEEVEEECRQLLEKREEELKDAREKVLRLAAELDNTRKRLEREKADGIAYANESILRQLTEVIDNLDRAIEHGEMDVTCEGLLDGVRMTHKSFLDVLARFGAAPFESVGSVFDPNRHEAVMQEKSTDYPDMTVTKEFQKGYTLRDRLLRPAKVGVARNAKDDRC
jgi:molecular chaperone GrpE